MIARLRFSCALSAALLIVSCGGEGDSDASTPDTDTGGLDSGARDTGPGPLVDTGPGPLVDTGPPGEDAGGLLEVPQCQRCDDDTTCNGGVCASLSPGLTVCATLCDPSAADQCPDGLRCTPSPANPDVARCVPPPGGQCCVDMDGDGFGGGVDCASPDCDDADDTIFPGATEICDGIDQSCSGRPDDDPAFECAMGEAGVSCETSCGTTGEADCAAGCVLGECVAAEACNGCDDDADSSTDEGFECPQGLGVSCQTACGSSGTAVCSDSCTIGACTPPAETCNGADDDCDFGVDEGFDCEGGSETACATTCDADGAMTGTRTCDATTCTLGACEAPAESCNGGDDDCDGRSDEDFDCVLGSETECITSCGSTGTTDCDTSCQGSGACVAPEEICNGLDDDCDDLVDEGFGCVAGGTVACAQSCDTGGAMTGVRDCSASCEPTGACRAPAETCDGLDNDCDSQSDETFQCAANSSRACTTSCDEAGAMSGLETCDSTTCTYLSCVPPAEICDGLDNDCDEVADNGFTCAVGASAPCNTSCNTTGTTTCGSSCEFDGACVPPAEVCNGLDDDCVDGPDDRFECVLNGPAGACETTCGGAPGTTICQAGSCTYSTDPADCTEPAEVCNGVDDDCDTVADEGAGECVAGEDLECEVSGCVGLAACDDSCNLGACDIGGSPQGDTCTTSRMPITATGLTVVPFSTCGAAATYLSEGCGQDAGPDIAIPVTLGSAGQLVVRTRNSTFNPSIHVHGPQACTNGQIGPEVGCDEDSGGGGEAEFIESLAAGTYWVVVDGAAGEQGAGELELEINPPPANDLCANATNINGAVNHATNEGGPVMGTIRGAESDHVPPPACTACNGNDVWYTFNVVGLSTQLLYLYVESDADLSVTVRELTCDGAVVAGGCNAGAGCAVGRSNSMIATVLTGSRPYYIAVDGCRGTDFKLWGSLQSVPDDVPLGQAARLVGTAQTVMGDTSNGATTNGFPACATGGGGDAADLHYFFTMCPNERRTIGASTCGAAFDTDLEVVPWRPTLPNANALACAATGCTTDDAMLSVAIQAPASDTLGQGWPVWINVDGNLPVIDTGPFTLNYTNQPAP